MNKPDGGPAFPVTPENEPSPNGSRSTGMTMRDYFASDAMRLIAPFSSGITLPEETADKYTDDFIAYSRRVAKWSYALADAMLAERSKP